MINGKYYFDKPITDIIKTRTSVRTYDNKPVANDVKEKLEIMLKGLEGTFNIKARLVLLDSNVLKEESGMKLGTYGVIKGASSFIVAAMYKNEKKVEELGYMLEKVILYTTSLGIGTCWLGGTFSKGEFAKAIELEESEMIPIVTPIGYESGNRRILETVMRFAAGSNNRKGWDELFFNINFGNKLSKQEAGKYAETLEMVRLAPSASNKQPWRIVKGKNVYHFFLQRTKGYAKALSFDMQRLDIGIAMCHFELTVREAGISGSWQLQDTKVENVPESTEYIISWVEE